MTDAERIEIVHALQASTRVLWFVVVCVLILAGLVGWALYQRREEAEENERRLANVKRIAIDSLDKQLQVGQMEVVSNILIAAGHDRREVRALVAHTIRRRAEMFGGEEHDERR